MLRLTHDLTAEGMDPNEIARLVRTGDLFRVRRGALDTDPADGLSPEQRHLRLLRATWPQLTADSVLSHASAGVLHELPVPLALLDRVHVSRTGAGGSRISRHLYRHRVAELPAPVEIEGIAVTDLCRTVVDLLCCLPFPEALAVADVAVSRRLCTDDLLDELNRGRRRGNRSARRAIALADPRAESPGESRSRGLMVQLGLPSPVLQYQVVKDRGHVVARSDFAWPERGLVGERPGGRIRREGEVRAVAEAGPRRAPGSHGREIPRRGDPALRLLGRTLGRARTARASGSGTGDQRRLRVRAAPVSADRSLPLPEIVRQRRAPSRVIPQRGREAAPGAGPVGEQERT